MVEHGRADARRNRERLLQAARAAFAAADGPVALEAIAGDAGVGIGTLYRHFPSREALIEAVYRAELAEVCASAADLLEQYPPAMALRRWMDRYAVFLAAKQGMAESLRSILASGAIEPSETVAGLVAAVELLLEAGAADGSLRGDVLAGDVISGLLGISLASRSPAQAQRLLDLLADGLAGPKVSGDDGR
jgi:AcrR family transcriptional regulator